MPLAAGTRLGPYEIIAPLGAGGMGEVYRARDSRLGRSVAIKVLPDSVAMDADRRARFEREAQAVAALSHPNILAIFDTGIHDGQPFAVTELLNGETLRERLTASAGAGAALPVRKAVEIAIQIARGLAAAQAKGLVHRDLKPENVFLLDDGQVKILDFGLARQMPLPQASGTLATIACTDPGLVLGTIGYMAPEQVRGLSVDARTDLFALGAVLYEMVTGRRAFARDTAADSLTAILTQEPADIAGVPDVPPALDRIVRHCLEKNPAERFQSARDVIFALESLTGSSAPSSALAVLAAAPRRRSVMRWLPAVAAVPVLLGAGWMASRAFTPAPAAADPIWLALLPPNGRFTNSSVPAISPDGTQIAFWAPDEAGRVMLWLRRLDSPDMRPLPGTEVLTEPYHVFWAPDGKRLAFFADGQLKRTSVDGGTPQVLADAANARGGSWSRSGQILFSPVSAAGIFVVPETGGTPARVPIADPENRPLQFPIFLPDGRHFLLSSTNGGVFLARLDDPGIRKISDVRSRVEYAAGYLFFEQNGGLYRQAFDIDRLETTGTPIRVSDRVGYAFSSFIDRTFSVAATGRLVVAEWTWQSPAQLTWYDRSGRPLEPVGRVAETLGYVLSPDRARAMVERHDPATNLTGPWIVDLSAGTEVRLTQAPGESIELTPTWSADESSIFFATLRGIFKRQVRGGQIVRLLEQDRAVWINDRSADGKYLVFETGHPTNLNDIWILTLGDAPAARPLVATSYSENSAVISPDGRAFAYVSNENGRREVFIDTFPQPQFKVPVSTGGGSRPEWRADSRELYFTNDRMLMAVAVDTTANPVKVGRPTQLFQLPIRGALNARRHYQPNAAGDRFLVNALVPRTAEPPVNVLLNWPAVVGR